MSEQECAQFEATKVIDMERLSAKALISSYDAYCEALGSHDPEMQGPADEAVMQAVMAALGVLLAETRTPLELMKAAQCVQHLPKSYVLLHKTAGVDLF